MVTAYLSCSARSSSCCSPACRSPPRWASPARWPSRWPSSASWRSRPTSTPASPSTRCSPSRCSSWRAPFSTRPGVAGRLLRFTEAIVGRGRGALAVITILVAMIIGGISGSGPACTAAVGGVMLSAMLRAGYPPGSRPAVTAAAGSTDILIPPSVAFIVYSVLVPSATVPALFVGGIIPGILACVMLIIPALFLSLQHNFGVDRERRAEAGVLGSPSKTPSGRWPRRCSSSAGCAPGGSPRPRRR